jgi:glutamine synthetase
MGGLWVDLIWTDIVGRVGVVRATREAAEAGGLAIPRGDVIGGFAGEITDRSPVELAPDWGTERAVPWENGVSVCLADLREQGVAAPFCSRSFLRSARGRLDEGGMRMDAAVELEFYLLDPATGLPLYDQIDNYSLSRVEVEPVITDLRNELRAMAVGVEASNPEYAGGQVEINISRADLLEAADQAVLARLYTGVIARAHGLEATFLSKPWSDRSSSGIHVHQSLWRDEANLFHDPVEGLGEAGLSYLAGMLAQMPEWALLTSPTPNGFHRRADGSFAPTVASWSVDNRTTAVRAVLGSEGSTRIEHRDGSADCNLYLTMGAQVIAGLDGIESGTEPPERVTGNAYEQDLPTLPRTFVEAFDRLEGSESARRLLPRPLLEAYMAALRPEMDLAITSSADWERRRYGEVPLG